MDIQTKDFPVIPGDATDEFPHGSFEVILSAPTQDRDGEIVDSKAFEPLPDHITFDTDHSMTCDSVVGSGVPSYAEDGTLRVKGGFASDERSQIIRQKVAEGHIRTTSVTFMAAKRVNDEKGVPHVTQAELLNGTFTPVPSNRESVVIAAKAITLKEGRRNSATDSESIQAIHDAASGLGASCEAMKALRKPRNTKSIVGSVEALEDRVQDALEDAYEGRWPFIRGVLADEGVVVFDACDDDWDRESWRQSYTDDGTVVTLVGDAVVVDIMEIVVPDADADREPDESLKMSGQETEGKAADDTAEAAADEAAATTVKSAAVPEDELARLRNTENAARIAFGA